MNSDFLRCLKNWFYQDPAVLILVIAALTSLCLGLKEMQLHIRKVMDLQKRSNWVEINFSLAIKCFRSVFCDQHNLLCFGSIWESLASWIWERLVVSLWHCLVHHLGGVPSAPHLPLWLTCMKMFLQGLILSKASF